MHTINRSDIFNINMSKHAYQNECIHGKTTNYKVRARTPFSSLINNLNDGRQVTVVGCNSFNSKVVNAFNSIGENQLIQESSNWFSMQYKSIDDAKKAEKLSQSDMGNNKLIYVKRTHEIEATTSKTHSKIRRTKRGVIRTLMHYLCVNW